MCEPMSSQVEHRDVHNVRIQVDVVTERQEHPILGMLGELLTAAPDRSLMRFMVSIITWWKAHNIRVWHAISVLSLSVRLSLGDSGRAVGQSSKCGLLRGGISFELQSPNVTSTGYSISSTILCTDSSLLKHQKTHLQISYFPNLESWIWSFKMRNSRFVPSC